MRIIDERTATVGKTVSTPEEALLALSADSEQRLARGLRYVWYYVHPDDAAADSDDDGADERERRTVRAVAEQRRGVLGTALSPDAERPAWRRAWSTWNARFDTFSEANVMDWPLTVSELRSQAALAEATIGELAAHLNAGLRRDLAALLRDCADFVSAEDGHGDSRAESSETVWDRFRSGSDLYELTVGEAAAAIAAGPARWDDLDEWRAAGGVDGDPYAVCRYAWGPLRARVELTAAELLDRYLAGDADLRLYRMVADYGEGPTEFIWPDQTRICCGFETGYGDVAAPVSIHGWGHPHVSLSASGRCCRICGTTYIGRLLTRRRLDSDETAPLGTVETLDALPPAALTAIARDGADAVACDLSR